MGKKWTKYGVLKQRLKGSGQPPLGDVMQLIKAAQGGNDIALKTLNKNAKKPGWKIAISDCFLILFQPETITPRIRWRPETAASNNLVAIPQRGNTRMQIKKCRHCDSPAIPGDDVCYQHIK